MSCVCHTWPPTQVIERKRTKLEERMMAAVVHSIKASVPRAGATHTH